MSFFAVLRSEGSQADAFHVLTCHVNFWSLGGFRKGSRFFCDVGLLVRANDQVRELDLALPFEVEGRVKDLYDRMLDKEIADLIWGEPVGLSVPKQARPTAQIGA